MSREILQSYLKDRNVIAFLRVIREGETDQTDDAYRRLFGKNKYFDDFTDHPRIKVYETYDGQFIKNNKIDYTTAAGAYQHLSSTWDGTVRQYGFPDFSPQCQDESAVALIIGRKAIEDVVEGKLEAACRKCSYEWASLPFSPYGQPTLTLDKAIAVFEKYGGSLWMDYNPEIDVNEEQEPAPVSDAIPTMKPGEEMPAPFLIPAITALISHAPELIRIFGSKPEDQAAKIERNAHVAEKVVEVVKAVTNAASGEEAVTKLNSNPELSAKFRNAVSTNMNEWLGVVIRLAEIDENSRDKAREFVSKQGRYEVFWHFSFIEFLTLIVIILTGIGATCAMIWGNISNELKAAIITMMIVGGFTTVLAFWFGSSLGSLVKNPPPKVER